jgi:hypothetical protein
MIAKLEENLDEHQLANDHVFPLTHFFQKHTSLRRILRIRVGRVNNDVCVETDHAESREARVQSFSKSLARPKRLAEGRVQASPAALPGGYP